MLLLDGFANGAAPCANATIKCDMVAFVRLPAPRRGIDIASWFVPETGYGHTQFLSLLKLAKWGGWRGTERPRYAREGMLQKAQEEFLVQEQT
jgi:hypothetical protein